jgi:peptide/nickel transport system permease protein
MAVKQRKQAETGETLKRRGQWQDVWIRLRRNKLAMVGLGIVLVLIIVAIFADFLAPYDYQAQDPGNRFCFPCAEHWFGTDDFGRDLLSRVIYGGRISLLVSLMAIVISYVLGGILGLTAGFYGGKADEIIMRCIDVLMAVPGILLAVCISSMLGCGVWQTAVAISISGISGSCRMFRASALSVRTQEFMEAAKASGSTNARAILTHLAPNCLAPIIVDMSLRLGGNIMMISGLSFIGLGVQPPTPEWGAILNSGREYIRDFWPIITFPGIAIMLTMFGFNVLGDGLRDALDPKLKR